jgi:hypothetical protein
LVRGDRLQPTAQLEQRKAHRLTVMRSIFSAVVAASSSSTGQVLPFAADTSRQESTRAASGRSRASAALAG